MNGDDHLEAVPVDGAGRRRQTADGGPPGGLAARLRQSRPVRWGAALGAALRYRFFLAAGLLPYGLGAALAHRAEGTVDGGPFWLGLVGVFCAGLGVEGLNEYFDSRIGGDRVFASPQRSARRWHLPLGLVGFSAALLAGLWLTALRGWAVLAFAALGGAAALAYLMPPVHLCYRGLGELTIALAYGPALTLGSFYLQAGRFSLLCLAASAVPGLLMIALAIANEVPDYHGDRLVGKRNLVVRTGRLGGVCLYGAALALCFGLLLAGVLAGWLPPAAGLALALAPVAVSGVVAAVRHRERPRRFVSVIRRSILLYVLVELVLILSFLID